MSAHWSWIWPSVGGTPIHEGLDSEMFDRDDYPYSETFVREAIQNSLDAALHDDQPVEIRFDFHEDRLGKRAAFLNEAIEFRRQAGLSVPPEWDAGRISWITVEDSNTAGLLGNLDDRLGDFWGYWLNFGRSNKSGTGRGGRGIGRVTFLLASKFRTVLGLTRRVSDGQLAACGMCVLKAEQFGSELKSTHAYLAERETGSIYELHKSPEFLTQLEDAFDLADRVEDAGKTGLSLVIPYPHEELTEDGILAAAVDHFAPAILDGSLVVEVGVNRLDKDTMQDVAPCMAKQIMSPAVSAGVERYLELIGEGQKTPSLSIRLPSPQTKLQEKRDTDEAKKLRADLLAGQSVAFGLEFPLRRKGVAHLVGLTVVAAPTPYGKPPIDRLFREGMSLPEVRSKRAADLDVVVLVEDPILAQYLNFCEGKAHLDLLGSKDVKAKLAEAGFEAGLAARRLVKFLPDQIREFLTEEITGPDASVWEGYFAVPIEAGERKKAPKQKKDEIDEPVEPPEQLPPPNISPVVVDSLGDGFRLRGNPKYTKFPATVDVTIAYADGSARPAWSEYDFTPRDLRLNHQNCSPEFSDNRLKVRDWTEESLVEVMGFDTRRELDTRIRSESNASQN